MLCVRVCVCVRARASVILFIYMLTDITWVQKKKRRVNSLARDDMNWLAAHATWLASSLVNFLGDAREEWRCLTRSKGRQIRQSIMGTHVKHAKHIVRTGRYDLRSGEIGVTGPNWLPPPVARRITSPCYCVCFDVCISFFFFFSFPFLSAFISSSNILNLDKEVKAVLWGRRRTYCNCFSLLLWIWKNIMNFVMNVWERESV